ncbi:hypothetical protein BGX28_000773 [Mortierella sp. GBA30]|nr:hypothetical protein BGX28_000773 [Mortierella sp. GBA30]
MGNPEPPSAHPQRTHAVINPPHPSHNVFRIPELVFPICSYLAPHDILQCILVSHHFHSLCIPILYSSVSILTELQFYRFVAPAAQLALARYGHHVRQVKTMFYYTLPCFLNRAVDCQDLTHIEFPSTCRFLEPVPPRGLYPQLDIVYNNMVERSTAEKRARNVVGAFDETILMSLMEKCPRLTVFSMVGFPFDNDLLIRQIADRLSTTTTTTTTTYTTATTTITTAAAADAVASSASTFGLKVLSLTNWHYCRVKAKSIEYLLDHCTPDLEELLLSISFGSRAEVDPTTEGIMEGVEQHDEDSGRIDTRIQHPNGKVWKLKKLAIKGDLTGSGNLNWLPLLRRSTQLVTIHMDLFTDRAMEKLASTLKHYCPQITEMTLRCSTGGPQEDGRVAELIGSSLAWKHLSMSFFHGFGPLSTTALIKHSITLETLVLEECDGFSSEDIQTVLSSCPNLRTFRAMTSNGRDFSSTVYLDANEMVDSPWVCHRLENLKLVITGIARPDLRVDQYGEPLTGPLHDGIIQGFELQRIVYRQLGQLTRLQELWLGHDKQDLDDEENYHRTEVEGQWRFIDPDEQFECLEFSLRSGLDLLDGLKDLRVLNLDRLRTRIGMSEVQWMARQWPKLEKVIGLVVQGETVPKYVQWLYDHHPQIALPPVLGNFFTSFS